MFHSISVISFLVVASLPVNWVRFANCSELGKIRTYFYDEASVQVSGGQISTTIFADYSQDRSARARHSELTWRLDCNARTFVEQSRTDFGAEGNVIRRYSYPTMTMRIGAGSVADDLARTLCSELS